MPAAVPDWDGAVVPRAKLVAYLLAQDHPEGGPKAAFFLSCGFDVARADDLETALLAQARSAAPSSVSSPHGMKYIVEGPIVGTDGRERQIRSVWIVDAGETAPRFVTAYPMEAPDGDR